MQRHADAAAALAEAKQHAPRIAIMLTDKKARVPELQAGLTTAGGEDETWCYRQSWRAVWENTGALDGLGQLMAGKT